VRHFREPELRLWRSGGWRHDWYQGRLGWWWVVGGVWYFYETPVYPYPLEVAEPVMVAPPPVVVAPAPPPQMWYYCDDPAGYYPYVATCSMPFRPVPAR
jgi:hypothetical protein